MDATFEVNKRDLALRLLILLNECSSILENELHRFVFERAELDSNNVMNAYGNLLHIGKKILNLWEDSDVNLLFFLD